MSIGYKKISEMISIEVNKDKTLNEEQKETLVHLCNKLYMLKASTDSVSGSRMLEDIMGEISLTADKLKEQGAEL